MKSIRTDTKKFLPKVFSPKLSLSPGKIGTKALKGGPPKEGGKNEQLKGHYFLYK
jgi:hypothetical protein